MARQVTEEQLLHFMEHPEEVDATDTELVEALASRELALAGDKRPDETEVDPDAKAARKAREEADAKIAAEEAQAKADAEAKAKADADAKAKETATTEGADKSGKQEEGEVLTKDGKHTLPYKVLKDEREARAAAEDALRDANQSVIALTERVKALVSGKDDPGGGKETKTADQLEEVLKAVGEQYPGMEDTLKPIVGAVRALEQKVGDIDAEREESEADARERLQVAANDALANNPTLVLWQTQAPALYAEAVRFDTMLRGEGYRGQFQTFEERFDRVVKLVKASHEGEEIPLPKAVVPASSTTTSSTSKTQDKPSAADVKKRAEEALAKAEAESVRTLTDIPGGEGEVSAAEHLGRMSTMDIAEKLMTKSPQEILQWVQSGAAARIA